LAVAVLALAGCSGGGERQPTSGELRAMPPQAAANASVTASPRVVETGRPVPRGGGIYKIGNPYQVGGRWYFPREEPGYDRIGIASWYGREFHGRQTANGEVYDAGALTAAHPTLPLPSYAYVTNLANGRTVLVRINDRGPYAHDRIVDLSRRVAELLGIERQGLGQVRVRFAGRAPLDGSDAAERRHLADQPWMRTAGAF
jgi:rare lipoprotein A